MEKINKTDSQKEDFHKSTSNTTDEEPTIATGHDSGVFNKFSPEEMEYDLSSKLNYYQFSKFKKTLLHL